MKQTITILIIMLITFSPMFWKPDPEALQSTQIRWQDGDGDSFVIYYADRGYGDNAYNAHKQPLDAWVGMFLDSRRNKNFLRSNYGDLR